MKQQFTGQALTIYVGEQDQWQGGPLFAAVVNRLKSAGLAGVTVLHGIEGFGAHRQVHTERIEVLFQALPIVIRAVDTSDKIAAVRPLLDEMLTEALVTVQDLQAIRYTKSSP